MKFFPGGDRTLEPMDLEMQTSSHGFEARLHGVLAIYTDVDGTEHRTPSGRWLSDDDVSAIRAVATGGSSERIDCDEEVDVYSVNIGDSFMLVHEDTEGLHVRSGSNWFGPDTGLSKLIKSAMDQHKIPVVEGIDLSALSSSQVVSIFGQTQHRRMQMAEAISTLCLDTSMLMTILLGLMHAISPSDPMANKIVVIASLLDA